MNRRDLFKTLLGGAAAAALPATPAAQKNPANALRDLLVDAGHEVDEESFEELARFYEQDDGTDNRIGPETRCKWTFGSPMCGYPTWARDGRFEDCDKTIAACRARGCECHFGGHPRIP